mgnify:CR=1 FL=1
MKASITKIEAFILGALPFPLCMRETSGADADTAARIEQMESAYGVEYDVWLTKL